MGQFKPMVKMFTDEPSVILKLKKGGKVKSKAAGQSEGFKTMAHNTTKMFEGAEEGKAPKKPSMMERRKAMNPNQYAKGGKVAHKQLGGAMPAVQNPAGSNVVGAAPMQAMGRAALSGMAPAQRAARAAAVRRAMTGMKKGGAACAALEKELKHHESMSMAKAHPVKKASGGKIDSAETKTTLKNSVKSFAKTKMDTAHKDKAHGTGEVMMGKPAGYKMGGTIEGNEKSFENTKMHTAKPDHAHGTGGVKMSNAGGYKKGGRVPGLGNAIEGGNWENRPANTGKPGVKNTKTGEVKEANAGGYKKGGAAKKAYATGGNVIDDGKAEKMPKHFVSRPVANSLQSGTFKKGGKVAKHASGGSQKDEYDPEDFHEEYEDSEGRIRTRAKNINPRYSETAVNKAISSSNRSGRKIGGKEAKAIHRLLKGRYDDGGQVEDLSKGAYDRAMSEKPVGSGFASKVQGAIDKFFGVKPAGSVTKTKESVTVSPGKKRGGKC